MNRYRATPGAPSVVIITPNDHGGSFGADPFLPGRLDPFPSIVEQSDWHLAVAQAALSGQLPPRVIRYYVLGAAVLRETQVWPPTGVGDVLFQLDANGMLARQPTAPGVDA